MQDEEGQEVQAVGGTRGKGKGEGKDKGEGGNDGEGNFLINFIGSK